MASPPPQQPQLHRRTDVLALIQARMLAMEREGTYPGTKYVQEKSVLMSVKYRVYGFQIMGVVSVFAAFRVWKGPLPPSKHPGLFALRFLMMIGTLPFGMALATRGVLSRLAACPDSVVLEEMCPRVVSHHRLNGQARPIPTEMLNVCERYCRNHPEIPIPESPEDTTAPPMTDARRPVYPSSSAAGTSDLAEASARSSSSYGDSDPPATGVPRAGGQVGWKVPPPARRRRADEFGTSVDEHGVLKIDTRD
eukprot:RCo045826